MAELSRVKKYKDLRDRLEEETTETSSNTKKEFSRSSKKSHESLSHANQPVRAHQQTKVKPNNEQGQKSPLMDGKAYMRDLEKLYHDLIKNKWR